MKGTTTFLMMLSTIAALSQQVELTYKEKNPIEEGNMISIKKNNNELDYIVNRIYPQPFLNPKLFNGFKYFVKTRYVIRESQSEIKYYLDFYLTKDGSKAFYQKSEI